MKKINFVISLNANYIYHMLSISKCGYINMYRTKYKNLHRQDDINKLFFNKHLLSVADGKKLGTLYKLITNPILSDEQDIVSYYSILYELFSTYDIKENFNKYYEINHLFFDGMSHFDLYKEYQRYKNEISAISKVMIENFEIYKQKVWPDTQKEIQKVINSLNKIFTRRDYIDEWEKLLKVNYEDDFYAYLCNAISNGPQGIAFANNKVLFSSTEYEDHLCNLISHELGLAMLKKVIKDYQYEIIESLAEFYNRQITEGDKLNRYNEKYIYIFESLKKENLTPLQLYNKAYVTKL